MRRQRPIINVVATAMPEGENPPRRTEQVVVQQRRTSAALCCGYCGRDLVDDVWCQRIRTTCGWSFLAVPPQRHNALEHLVIGETALIVKPEWPTFDNKAIQITPTFCRLHNACPVHGTLYPPSNLVSRRKSPPSLLLLFDHITLPSPYPRWGCRCRGAESRRWRWRRIFRFPWRGRWPS